MEEGRVRGVCGEGRHGVGVSVMKHTITMCEIVKKSKKANFREGSINEFTV